MNCRPIGNASNSAVTQLLALDKQMFQGTLLEQIYIGY